MKLPLTSGGVMNASIQGALAIGDGKYVVSTHLEGDFPGGEVDLAQSFTLVDGLISDLTTRPVAFTPWPHTDFRDRAPPCCVVPPPVCASETTGRRR